ncbi:hypothetical protein BCR34DRAFT_571692, partial [Clohesyomyces aquaticus]
MPAIFTSEGQCLAMLVFVGLCSSARTTVIACVMPTVDTLVFRVPMATVTRLSTGAASLSHSYGVSRVSAKFSSLKLLCRLG